MATVGDGAAANGTSTNPIPKTDWAALITAKRQGNIDKIPKEWKLEKSLLANVYEESKASVLDVPKTCGILTEKELELTGKYDATALIAMMAKGDVTSVEVTTAFCKRAAIAQQLTNCLTEIFFDKALSRAKECDDHLAKHGKPMGPLHGLPISLKDSFNVEGTHSTIGYVSFLTNPAATKSSVVVEFLKRCGAVFYCKTNLPQSMMTADSENRVFGRTLNPNKLCLTAGGSTGGEGALIKMRGSVMGVATDVAGSIRIPAHCNGVFGLKPCVGRVPFLGGTPPGRLGSPGSIGVVAGPVTHSVRDADLFMKCIMDCEPWTLDENVISVPWRTVDVPRRPLRLGVLTKEAKSPLHPPMARAMDQAARMLKNAGNEIIELDGQAPSFYDTGLLSWKYFLLDPKKTPLAIMKAGGEEPVASIFNCRYLELEGWEPTLDALFDMNMERAKIVRVYHDLWVKYELDGIIMPTYHATAVPHDTYGVPPFTVLANLLNFPSFHMPFLNAEKELDRPYIQNDVHYVPPYDADIFEGAPCGFQIVGRPMKEEELVKVADTVANTLDCHT